jgi:hypothetical protein
LVFFCVLSSHIRVFDALDTNAHTGGEDQNYRNSTQTGANGGNVVLRTLSRTNALPIAVTLSNRSLSTPIGKSILARSSLRLLNQVDDEMHVVKTKTAAANYSAPRQRFLRSNTKNGVNHDSCCMQQVEEILKKQEMRRVHVFAIVATPK